MKHGCVWVWWGIFTASTIACTVNTTPPTANRGASSTTTPATGGGGESSVPLADGTRAPVAEAIVFDRTALGAPAGLEFAIRDKGGFCASPDVVQNGTHNVVFDIAASELNVGTYAMGEKLDSASIGTEKCSSEGTSVDEKAATDGQVEITSVDGSRIQGSYDFVVGGQHMSGKFEATRCDLAKSLAQVNGNLRSTCGN